MPEKEIVSTNNAPAAIGPYSQGVKAGPFLFISGQIPVDPATGELVTGSIEEQTRRVMENLKAILAAAGLEMSRVVKTTIFLTDLSHFAAVNAVYGDYFPTNPPARSTVEVSSLPKGVGVEVEAVALL
ncbi:MAG TPA: RidA family protein [Armatimonadota bacterium]|jgi:2-iminobutanoate/2-iminopropanoate deaminase|nr:RidA family protein [Armatimonadota bacterium]HOJ21566.1 RidA family protein [Armatimonadota bacterium]HOM82446.1 RidA family protein [Armatimonadota bacterium]HOQ28655.1 RidA family protein [Armatimonadota bacterium]HPO72504.1 RidA family protein [Armatimonadota bacterium]